MGYLRRVHGVTLRVKAHSLENRKTQNAKLLFRIERSQLPWFGHVSKMSQERLTKLFDGYTPGKAAQRLSKDQVTWLHLRSCLVLFQCWPKRIFRDFCWSWSISGRPRSVSRVVAPRLTPKKNWIWKWLNEMYRHWTFLFIKLPLVCLPIVNILLKQIKHIWTETCLFVKII